MAVAEPEFRAGDTPSELVLSETADGILRLTLNSPRTRNALSQAMMRAISAALTSAGEDAGVKVVIVSASGPVFCAGHDLKEMTEARNEADGGDAFFRETFAQCAALMQQIVRHPKPVIAEVQGMATAAGCQLVASCDLAVASENAHFCTPGVHIGLFCSTPMVALSRNVANKHAMEMLLTGDPISAGRAYEIGLVNRVADAKSLHEATQALATRIATKSPMTLKTGKQAFYEQAPMKLGDAYAYTARIMVENMLRDDAKEGIAAFIERRDANWPDA